MGDKTITGIVLTMLLVGVLTPAFNLVTAGADVAASAQSSSSVPYQPPAAQWNKTYGGTNDDYALSIVQTGDGGYAIAGSVETFQILEPEPTPWYFQYWYVWVIIAVAIAAPLAFYLIRRRAKAVPPPTAPAPPAPPPAEAPPTTSAVANSRLPT